MATNVPGKALGVERIVGQKIDALGLHFAATLAVDPAYLKFQVHEGIATGKITNAAHFAIIPTEASQAAATTTGFFERRTRVTIRAFGSPKTPLIVARGRKPGNV